MRRSKASDDKLRKSKEDAELVRQSLKEGKDFAVAAEHIRRPNEIKSLPLQYEGASYGVLLESIIEADCPIAAKYFAMCVEKENEIFQLDLTMKRRVRDAHCLLLAIVENIKSAETVYANTRDKELTLKLLLQTVHMVQIQDDAFHWLVKEIYRLILKITQEWETECTEMLSRTRFEYGVVLTEKGDHMLEEAIYQLERSLETCKGTMWYTNEKDRNILQEDCCVKLCETLLRLAKIRSKTAPNNAAELAYRAVVKISDVGISLNKNLFCIATLRRSEYLIASKEYETSLKVLHELQNHIMAHDNPRNKCEFYLWLGICFFYLSPYSMAMRKFKLSLCISEKYCFEDLRAAALLFLGKIHAQDPSAQPLARQCFIEAKNLFIRLSDFENEKLAKYLMAKQRAYHIFPNYIELMKKASSDSFCYFFDLVQWKQKMIPFWNDHGQLHKYENEIRCLLEEQVGKELLIKID